MSWDPVAIDEVVRLFAAARGPWWIAGGCALDLFVGRQLRPHGDLDVQLLRGSERELPALFAGWELFTARDGVLTPWQAADRATCIWCRRSPSSAWGLELLIGDAVDETWVYRRDPRITRPIAELGAHANGVPYLRPEVQLLFKSKTIRDKDEADLHAVLPQLEPSARAWLRDALAIVEPGHRWLALLDA